MASPPLEQPFDHMAARAFSFFPPIVGVEHNEWLLRQVNWSEVLVVNQGTNQELWIPRRYFGEASRIEDPVLIVGLTREMEYQGGMLRPYKQRLIKMPSGQPARSASPGGPDRAAASSMMRVRAESSDKRAIKLIGIVVGCIILLWVLGAAALRVGFIQQHIVITTRDQTFQTLTSRDDRFAIVTKIGKQPAFDRFKEVGTIQYEALSYPERKYTVILMGADTRTLAYIGTVDDNWRPVHFVNLRSGGTTESLLQTITRF
jgi:hypothetical protein